MNFNQLKEKIEADIHQESAGFSTIKPGSGKNNPVNAIRANMRLEILTQLAGVIILLCAPFTILYLDKEPKAIYLIFMFITCIMIMAYVIKLTLFLRQTGSMTRNTVATIQQFIYEAKLTLQVYKSFGIAGTLLLPVPVFALLTGNSNGYLYNPDLFEKWMFLNISYTELILLVTGYLLLVGLFYITTIKWSDFMYGRHLKQLEKILLNLEEE